MRRLCRLCHEALTSLHGWFGDARHAELEQSGKLAAVHGSAATVRMNDPERRNAFSMPRRIALLNTFRALEADQTARTVVFTGSDKMFCVDGDPTGLGNQPMGAFMDRMRIVQDVARLMAQSSKPFIAVVEGWAVGSGLSPICWPLRRRCRLR